MTSHPLKEQTTLEGTTTFGPIFEEVRAMSEIDFVGIVRESVPLTPKGAAFVGPCPFCKDRKGTLNVFPTDAVYRCFSCGDAGDVFRFVQQTRKIDFPEAVRHLAERANTPLANPTPEIKDAAEIVREMFDPKPYAGRIVSLNVQAGTIDIKFPPNGFVYSIPARDILAPQQFIDWVFHLMEKNDATPEMMHEFLQCVDNAARVMFKTQGRRLGHAEQASQRPSHFDGPNGEPVTEHADGHAADRGTNLLRIVIGSYLRRLGDGELTAEQKSHYSVALLDGARLFFADENLAPEEAAKRAWELAQQLFEYPEDSELTLAQIRRANA